MSPLHQRRSRLQALGVLVRVPDRVNGGRVGSGAIRMPPHGLLLIQGLLRLAQAIRRDVEGILLGNAVLLHADLSEQVLTHGAILALLDADLPVGHRRLLAGLNVGEQDAEGGLGEDLQAAEEAEVHLGAVLQEGTLRRHGHQLDARDQLVDEEDRISIGLDRPVVAGVHAGLLDGLPRLVEDAGVDVLAGELPLRELPVAIRIHELLGREAAEAGHDIGVDLVGIAGEDAGLLRVRNGQQLLVVALLGRTVVLHVHGEAVRGSALMGVEVERVGEDSARPGLGAVGLALRLRRALLDALGAGRLAALGGHAVLLGR
mmetsp:Transcript_50450/g.161489  ORF Transcript_50450/g.161489 Transcript_50450/m.161489 type:complete len:317 (+) Transcript_50450:196-1146(+)